MYIFNILYICRFFYLLENFLMVFSSVQTFCYVVKSSTVILWLLNLISFLDMPPQFTKKCIYVILCVLYICAFHLISHLYFILVLSCKVEIKTVFFSPNVWPYIFRNHSFYSHMQHYWLSSMFHALLYAWKGSNEKEMVSHTNDG